MQQIVHALTFSVRPSLETNDHELRILINGEDVFDRLYDRIGLDPPTFFAQAALREGGGLLIGRCTCGVIGCDDLTANVTIGETSVRWDGRAGDFVFAIAAYRTWLSSADEDHSWEDAKRRAERLVADVLAGMRLADGSGFRWAHARSSTEPRRITLSFGKDGLQVLRHFGWDGETVQTAVLGAERFRRRYGT